MDAPTQRSLLKSMDASVTFLTTVFEADDLILFRPIEVWNEGNRKRSRVDYKHQRYLKADREALLKILPQLLEESTNEKTNQFFGVSPRFGGAERYDLASQIRIVRVLWADLDNVTIEEAMVRVNAAGFPKPSIVVRSGNGVHLYWILDAPYLIDDVSEPSPLLKEWEPGCKKPKKYVFCDDEKVLFDKRLHSKLSAKALHFQDILAGIAELIGGDHTQDLSRLLRVPGTMNRKDERNGREPVPCTLHFCDPTLRYSISVFEPFKKPCADTMVREKIQKVALPTARKKLTNKLSDDLAGRVTACDIAEPGKRSHADYALCMYCIKKGIDKEHIWGMVGGKGKFAERGREYFDMTWGKAEEGYRIEHLQELQPGIFNSQEEQDEFDGAVITVDGSTPVCETLTQITDRMIDSKTSFLRSNQLVIVRGETIKAILSHSDLKGMLNQHVEFRYVEKNGMRFRPLTPEYGETWLHKSSELCRLPEIKMFTRNPVFTLDWRLVGPGFDSGSGIYYAGAKVEPQSGCHYLDELLQDFCFKSSADRTNFIGILLTAVLMPHFIGSKPAVIFNGNQPELGKSMLAQIIALIRDGQPTETATYNPNDEEFEKRLGGLVKDGFTTLIIDNAKATGRRPRIESACLERSITDHVLSYRLLGHSGSIRAENSHIFAITANWAEVSADLVSRSTLVALEYEGNPKLRCFLIANPEAYAMEHRAQLLGELVGMVQSWIKAGKPMASVTTRFNKQGWGNIVGGILAHAGLPDFLGNAEEAAVVLDETRREFAELVALLADHPQGTWTATELVELCRHHDLLNKYIRDGNDRSLATKMGGMASRYINVRFDVPGDRKAEFIRVDGGKTNTYRIKIIESAGP